MVAVNDIAPLETCAYLFTYGSVCGPLRGGVDTSGGTWNIDGRSICHLGFSCVHCDWYQCPHQLNSSSHPKKNQSPYPRLATREGKPDGV
ncbi:MAG: hypothetical protein HOI22_02615 [Tateyamaria sp.]|nr:hypothetical protein [Tateyamaria sp.]